jgi:hypothetical protein
MNQENLKEFLKSIGEDHDCGCDNKVNEFITHIVTNWPYPINEAFSQSIVNKMVQKYREEAEDFDIEVSEDKLRQLIDRFDRIKDGLPNDKRDITKYTLKQIMRVVSSMPGDEEPEEDAVATTPDVVYDENGLIIYNGAKENNCLTYGSGERWCITRGSFGTYRYDVNRKNPTFYLVKDTTLPQSDPKSFFIVVVGSDNTYKVSDRTNNDVGGRQTEWDRWENFEFVTQHFPRIRGLQRIFRYIPISPSEKITQQYKNGNGISFRTWANDFSFEQKKQYIVVRKDNQIFSDISNPEFVAHRLKNYQAIADFISTNDGLIHNDVLLRYFDVFNNQQKRSIIANIQTPLNEIIFSKQEIYPYSALKGLVGAGKIHFREGNGAYINRSADVVVYFRVDGSTLNISIVGDGYNYDNIKLTPRTEKFLFDYPQIDNLPLNAILNKISQSRVSDEAKTTLINRLRHNADQPGSRLKRIETGDNNEVIMDTTTFSGYQIVGDDFRALSPGDMLGLLYDQAATNSVVQGMILSNIMGEIKPENISLERWVEMIKSLPERMQTLNMNGTSHRAIYNPIVPEVYYLPNDPRSLDSLNSATAYTSRRPGGATAQIVPKPVWEKYFEYQRERGLSFDGEAILEIFRRSYGDATKKDFLKAEPPINQNSTYLPKIHVSNDDENILFVNRQNPSNSFRLRSGTGNVFATSLPDRLVRWLLSYNTVNAPQGHQVTTTQPTQQAQPQPTQQQPQPQGDIRRRGRPPGGAAPRQPQQAPAPHPNQQDGAASRALEHYGLFNGFNTLSRATREKLLRPGNAIDVASSRGASARNSQMGGRGHVVYVVLMNDGTYTSQIYVIRLASGRYIASVVAQPGNTHYIVTADSSFSVADPRNIGTTLTQHNLSEAEKAFVIDEFCAHYPDKKHIAKAALKTYLDENKNKQNEN